jgi:hypothetical protein
MDPEKSSKAIEKIKERFPGDLSEVKSTQVSNAVYRFTFRNSSGSNQKALIYFELEPETANIYPRIMDANVAEMAFKLLSDRCPNSDLSLLTITTLKEQHQRASKDLTPDIFDWWLQNYSECYWFKNFKDNEGYSHAAMICFDRDTDGNILDSYIRIG